MTDQPTTWTPERALEMLRDLSNDAIEGPAFLAKWGSHFDPEQVAMDALESAAAEIERQKARADRAERALVGAGWQDLGGAEWKPPLGKPPRFFEVMPKEASEELAYLRSEIERLRAELAKEKERAETFIHLADTAEHEVKKLRAELATVTKREADGVALFDQLLAEERAKVAKLRADLAGVAMAAGMASKQPAEAEAAQQGTSDEEIRDAIESVHMCGDNVTANALRLIARRAGVKL